MKEFIFIISFSVALCASANYLVVQESCSGTNAKKTFALPSVNGSTNITEEISVENPFASQDPLHSRQWHEARPLGWKPDYSAINEISEEEQASNFLWLKSFMPRNRMVSREDFREVDDERLEREHQTRMLRDTVIDLQYEIDRLRWR